MPAETTDLWFKRGGRFLKPGAAQTVAPETMTSASGTAGRPNAFEVALASPGIELFLSPHGAGVLPLAFESKEASDLGVLRELCYRLSQLRPFTSFAFHLPHGERNPNPLPAPDAPLTERLGHAGGAFRLAELATRLRELNGHALAFTVNGCFTEVSAREAHNQYYELVQSAQRVRDSFGTVQQALRDAEAMENDRFQGETLTEIGTVADKLQALVSEAANNARLVAHVQSKVEWLEVFFVSYYFTALMYYVGHGGLFTHKYTVVTLVLAPLVSGTIAFVGLKPHRLHRASGHTAETHAKPHPRKERTWWFLLLLISTFVLWLGVGLRFFPGEGLSHGGEHPAAAATELHDAGQH